MVEQKKLYKIERDLFRFYGGNEMRVIRILKELINILNGLEWHKLSVSAFLWECGWRAGLLSACLEGLKMFIFLKQTLVAKNLINDVKKLIKAHENKVKKARWNNGQLNFESQIAAPST